MSSSGSLRHRQVQAEGISIHVAEGGAAEKPAVFFLHGWPESWAAFEPVMVRLADEAHVIAMDLPGIGGSEDLPASNDKRTLAKYVRGVIRSLDLQAVTLVGHDVGGQIVYAYLQAYPDELQRAVIMNVAIPGVEPWSEIKRNPSIWHFTFHAIPGLPEQLVTGREAAYFAYFFDRISATPEGVGQRARETYVRAYSRPEALHTGFEWYRAFSKDENDNLEVKGQPIQPPVLYLRGEKDPGLALERYVDGLRQAGLRNVQGRVIPDCGHFSADEQPDEVSSAIRKFLSERL